MIDIWDLEDASFKNLVLFYAKELRAMDEGASPFTKSEKRVLCKRGICHRQITKKHGRFTGAISILTARAKEILRDEG